MDIKKQFIRYVSQNMLGMLGMSLYILADTYFISKAVGADGITALNLVLPVYNLIFAIGAMIGVGSAIRFVIERNIFWTFFCLLASSYIGIIKCFPGVISHKIGNREIPAEHKKEKEGQLNYNRLF